MIFSPINSSNLSLHSSAAVPICAVSASRAVSHKLAQQILVLIVFISGARAALDSVCMSVSVAVVVAVAVAVCGANSCTKIHTRKCALDGISNDRNNLFSSILILPTSSSSSSSALVRPSAAALCCLIRLRRLCVARDKTEHKPTNLSD